MIKKNVLGSKYVNISANNISSRCTSSIGTIFTWGADTEQRSLWYTEQELKNQKERI
jgi:hypothetical protein